MNPASSSLTQISDQYRETSADVSHGWMLLLAPIVALAAAGIIVWWYNRIPTPTENGDRLLVDLCGRHRLGRKPTALLLRVAHAAELAHPASLVVVPEIFERGVEQASHRIRYGKRDQQAIAEMRRRLFTSAG